MVRVFVSVGSNVDPEASILRGLARLAERVPVTAASTFHRTPPVGPAGSAPFLNGVVACETTVPPRELKWRVLRAVEAETGRVRSADKYAPRTLDLDVLLYGNRVVQDPDLMIPDPDLRSRPFLALPLLELAPDLVLPDDGTPLADVAARFRAPAMTPAPGFTARLRTRLNLAPGDPSPSAPG